jgi:hypothetical protein
VLLGVMLSNHVGKIHGCNIGGKKKPLVHSSSSPDEDAIASRLQSTKKINPRRETGIME